MYDPSYFLIASWHFGSFGSGLSLVDLQAVHNDALISLETFNDRVGVFAAERPLEGAKLNPPHRLARRNGFNLGSQPFYLGFACLELTQTSYEMLEAVNYSGPSFASRDVGQPYCAQPQSGLVLLDEGPEVR